MTSRPPVPRIRSRPALFFIGAIVMPCTLLVLLTVRMMMQDRELSEKRVLDERHRLATDARQALIARVERMRLSVRAEGELPPGVVLVADVTSGTVVFPWERPTRARYQSAQTQNQRLGDLARARALFTTGRRAESDELLRHLLALPPDAVDDQGIPYALYAARQLLDTRRSDINVADALARVLRWPSTGPAAVYMVRDLAQRTAGSERLAQRAHDRIAEIDQALAMRAALPTVGLPASLPGMDTVWTTVGPAGSLWLVNVTPQTNRTSTLTAVRTTDLVDAGRDGVRIVADRVGESLAPNFPTLSAIIEPSLLAPIAHQTERQRPLYLATLAVVVGIALAGGYLFWRDVQREIRLSDLRAQFVSSVSHELKTPVTSIRMFAETLLAGRSGVEHLQHEYLETIVDESERLTRLLNNVLDFSKIESGKKTYRLEPCSPAAIVHAAVRAMRYSLEQQGFTLRVVIDETLPPVGAESDAVEQAVLNLISNAMKYSGDAREITLSLARDGHFAAIAVEDRGIGIKAEHHARIFEKFYRVHDAATARVAGTGLGLTLVDHVARGHNGAVVVRSAPGTGSTFILKLPLLDPAVVAHTEGAFA